jgi:uncharacterized protein YegL
VKTRRPKPTVPAILDTEQPIEKPALRAIPMELSEALLPGQVPNETPTPKEFARNAEERLPCLLILDTSESMFGDPIDRLTTAMKEFSEALLKHPRLRRSIDILVVSYNDNPTVEPFVSAADWKPRQLIARGRTATACAIGASLDTLEKRSEEYNAAGISFHVPWGFLFTDGFATETAEETQAIAARIHQMEAAKRLKFFPVGVNSSAMRDYLASLTKMRSPLWLTDIHFDNFFRWLYVSSRVKRDSLTTEEIELPPLLIRPGNPLGWGQV